MVRIAVPGAAVHRRAGPHRAVHPARRCRCRRAAGSSSAARSPSRRCSARSTRACGWPRSCAASARPTRWPARAGCCARAGRALRGRGRLRGRADVRPAAGHRRCSGCARRTGSAAARHRACAPARGWRCRCSRAPSSGRSPSPPRWTPAATAVRRTTGRVSRRLTARARLRRAARGLRRRLRAARRHRAAWLGLPMLLVGVGARRRAACTSAAGAAAAPATGPTRGRCPSGWSPACGVVAAAAVFVDVRPAPGGFYLASVTDGAAGAAAGRRGHPGRRAARPFLAPPLPRRPRPAGAPATRDGPTGRRWPRDPLRAASASPSPTRPAPVLADVDLTIPEGELAPRRRPHRLRQVHPAAAPSTAWCRTSPAAPCTAGSSSTAATPATTGRATSPTSSATSARTRSPGSSPTPSRTSSPTAWSQLGLPADVMRKRVEETLDLLGLAELRDRPLRDALRRAAAAGRDRRRCSPRTRGSWCSTSRPPPSTRPPPRRCSPPSPGWCTTSASPCVLAEHRLERVVQYADRVVLVPGGDGAGRRPARPAEVLRRRARRPAGGRARPARRLVAAAAVGARRPPRAPAPLRDRLAAVDPPAPAPAADAGRGRSLTGRARRGRRYGRVAGAARRRPRRRAAARSSRSWAATAPASRRCCGRWSGMKRADRRPGRGRRRATPRDAAARRAASAHVGLVPQDAGDLLYLDTVGAECDAGRPRRRRARRHHAGAARPARPRHRRRRSTRATCPRGSGSPWRWRSCWPPRPPLLLLDEPTRGLDYTAKHRWSRSCATWPPTGTRCVLATHDVEFVAEVADRVRGDGRGRDRRRRARPPTSWSSSPAFAPQVAKVLAPQPLAHRRPRSRAALAGAGDR